MQLPRERWDQMTKLQKAAVRIPLPSMESRARGLG